MDFKIAFSILCVLAAESAGGKLEFPVAMTDMIVCADAPPMSTIDRNVVSGGGSSIYYTLTGNDTEYFDIDNTSGVLSVAKDSHIQNVTGTRVVLHKQACDETGPLTDMELRLNLANPVIHAIACPKILSLTVREIAAINEEIEIVECLHNQPRTGLNEEHKITSIKIMDVSSRINPFGITRDGIIYVAKPLVCRNNINDIYIMNVTMVYLKGHDNPATNCNRTEMKVTVKIEVLKADCPTDQIQYELNKNLYLDHPAFDTVPSCTLDECMNQCTNKSSRCHSFNYNVLKRECQLLNETKYTLDKATFRRLGLFLYRKYCQTEPLPSAAMRRVLDKTEHAVIFSAVHGLFVMYQLMSALQKARNITLQDLDASASVVTTILNKTDLSSGSFQDVKNYAQFCCLLLDMLIVSAANLPIQAEGIRLYENNFDEQAILARSWHRSTAVYYYKQPLEALQCNLSSKLQTPSKTPPSPESTAGLAVSATVIKTESAGLPDPNAIVIEVPDSMSAIIGFLRRQKDVDYTVKSPVETFV